MRAWYAMGTKAVLEELKTSGTKGLSAGEAQKRLERYGRNELKAREGPGLLKRLLGQLRDPMVLVLLGAAGLSLWAGGGEDWVEAVIILGIVVLNAVISLSQEDSAQRALEALRDLSAPMADVLRDGRPCRVEAGQLVPGDLIRLEAGDLVPADARVLSAAGLTADESAMTGESLPVAKEACGALPPETPLGDRKNMVLAGTVITAGRGTCVITATGMETEMGHIAGLLLEQGEGETPLQKKMAEISGTLSFLCLCVCAVMFGVGLLRGKGILDMFLTAVSLAVAAIPEGLPAVVTIVLALGVQRMAKRGAIVRRLPAVETLGCAGVICSDKTGTLTQNRMTVQEVWTPGGDRNAVLSGGALCSDAELVRDGGGTKAVGDPTECAIVEAARGAGLDKSELERKYPRQGECPFDSDRKRMSTLHPMEGGGCRLLVKGAPDVLFPLCAKALGPNGEMAFTPALQRRAAAANEAMAQRALRVLAVARRDLPTLPAGTVSKYNYSGATAYLLDFTLDGDNSSQLDTTGLNYLGAARLTRSVEGSVLYPMYFPGDVQAVQITGSYDGRTFTNLPGVNGLDYIIYRQNGEVFEVCPTGEPVPAGCYLVQFVDNLADASVSIQTGRKKMQGFSEKDYNFVGNDAYKMFTPAGRFLRYDAAAGCFRLTEGEALEPFEAYIATSVSNPVDVYYPPLVTTGLQHIDSESGARMSVYATQGGISIYATRAEEIAIYRTDGALAGTVSLAEGENFYPLPSGIYIVKNTKVAVP